MSSDDDLVSLSSRLPTVQRPLRPRMAKRKKPTISSGSESSEGDLSDEYIPNERYMGEQSGASHQKSSQRDGGGRRAKDPVRGDQAGGSGTKAGSHQAPMIGSLVDGIDIDLHDGSGRELVQSQPDTQARIPSAGEPRASRRLVRCLPECTTNVR